MFCLTGCAGDGCSVRQVLLVMGVLSGAGDGCSVRQAVLVMGVLSDRLCW